MLAGGSKQNTTLVNETPLKKIVQNPPENKTIIENPNIFDSVDYAAQIWPLDEQKREQLQLATQYEDLCRELEKKLNTQQQPKDHNSRAEQIKERMRKKWNEKKKILPK